MIAESAIVVEINTWLGIECSRGCEFHVSTREDEARAKRAKVVIVKRMNNERKTKEKCNSDTMPSVESDDVIAQPSELR